MGGGADERMQQQLHDLRVMNQYIHGRKFKITIAFYLVTSLIATFYVCMFVFSRNIFQQYQKGFY